jgi:hypothetical protein
MPGLASRVRRIVIGVLMITALSVAGTGVGGGDRCGIAPSAGADRSALCGSRDTDDAARICPDGDSSKPCRKRVEKRETRRTVFRTACWSDVGAVCPQATTARQVRECLHQHRSELSVDCRETLSAPR